MQHFTLSDDERINAENFRSLISPSQEIAFSGGAPNSKKVFPLLCTIPTTIEMKTEMIIDDKHKGIM